MRVGLRLLVGSTVMLAACNAIVGFDDLVRVDDPDGGAGEGGPPGDGGLDGEVPTDAADAGRCNPLARFDAPELEKGLNDVDGGKAQDAVLTPDELEIFFVRTIPPNVTTLRHGQRSDRTKPWTEAQLAVDSPNPGAPTSGLSIANGGLRLYFRDSGQSSNFYAARPAPNLAFTSSMMFLAPEIQGPMFIGASNESVYGRFRPDSGAETVLGRGTNTGTGATAFQVIPNLHVAGATDERPVLNASETKIYFTSQRDGELASSIYVATRASKSAEFGAPTRVGELSTFGLENTVTWVSDDDCEVLLNRVGDVYHARRPP
jgi:hypothetical protein